MCSGLVLEVDNNEHQSMEVESNKEKKDNKVDKYIPTYIVRLIDIIVCYNMQNAWLSLVKLKTN